MKPHVSLAAPRAYSIICCPVAGFGILRVTPDQVAALRLNPQPSGCRPLSLPLLKHADGQTVAGLGAVLQAIQRHGLAETDFSEWGVVAAPTYLGRAALATTLQRLAVEGAWGISPHFIPHHSLHAVSGTISQALKIHGPNFGIEASPSGIAEALTVAATLLAGGKLPGLWLVLSEYETELLPEDPEMSAAGSFAPPPECIALALALVPDASLSQEAKLRICPQGDNRNGHAAWTSWEPLEDVYTLADALRHRLTNRHWRLGLHGWMELTDLDLGPENGV